MRGPPRWPLDFCVGQGLGASAGGLMYAFVAGVGCTLWCSRAAALAAGLLRGRRGTCGPAGGLIVRFGVRGPPRWPLDFCVAGVGLAALQGGLMYALVFAGRRAGRWTFAWQAWGVRRCKGPGVRFGVRGPPRWPLDFCVAGVGIAFGVAVPIGDGCLAGMRVWRLAVCKLRSG